MCVLFVRYPCPCVIEMFVHRRLTDKQTNPQAVRRAAPYLAGAEGDPVVVLLPMFLAVLQLLSAETHSHRAQILIHPKIVPVL